MPRRPTGSIVETGSGRFALRFRACGRRQYVTLAEGTTRAQAEAELAYVLAQVERGEWQPARPVAATEIDAEAACPTFHVLASEWLEVKALEVRESTQATYKHALTDHLLPFFHAYPVDEITVRDVDRYREHKLRENRISGTYLNKTITLLGAILDVADERDLIDRNPVRVNPRNRKVKTVRKRTAYLDRSEQIEALLAAAGALDREARPDRDNCLRRPLLALLTFSGLRIGEALALRWRDVDLAGGRLRVRASKTDAGERDVPILPVLRDELLARRASSLFTSPDDPVFCTRAGKPLSKANTRTRILGVAHRRADDMLEAAGLSPLPERLTQHSLRHTYISLRVAIGDDIATIAQDAGHADMSTTFRIYTHVMRADEEAKGRLSALCLGSDWAETPDWLLPDSGDFTRPAGFEPATSCSGGSDGADDEHGENACNRDESRAGAGDMSITDVEADGGG